MFKQRIGNVIGDRKVQTTGLAFLSAILIAAFGWDETTVGKVLEVTLYLVGTITALLKGKEALAGQPTVMRTTGDVPAEGKPPASIARPKGWTRGLPVIGFVVMTAVIQAGNIGCDPMADRMVDRHSTELAADLRVRGQMARAAIETQYEAVRTAKHAEIDAVWDESLKALELFGQLNAESSRKAADRFGAFHRLVDARVDAYKAAALEQARWFDLAADTVLATMEYRQTKDAAIVEGLKAGLESFGVTYAATKREPADESEAKAQALIADLEAKLQGLMQAYTGVPKG